MTGKEDAMLSSLSTAWLRLATYFESEEGQALAEYGLILALVSVAGVVVLAALAGAVTGMLGEITAAMP